MMNSLEPKNLILLPENARGVLFSKLKLFYVFLPPFYLWLSKVFSLVVVRWRNGQWGTFGTNIKRTPTRLDTMQPRDEHSWILYRKNLHFITILNHKGRSTDTRLCACVFSLRFLNKWWIMWCWLFCFLTINFPF